jgi:hypothetical protein
MREVLPIGAKWPRRGNTVRVLFGEAYDAARDVRELAEGDAPLSGRALWEALAARAHERLRGLEERLHPAASAVKSDVPA